VDLDFLAGAESPYCKSGNDFFLVDEMDLTNAGMWLERWENAREEQRTRGSLLGNEQSKRVLLAVYRYMTGCEACYLNEKEDRSVCEDGVMEFEDTLITINSWAGLEPREEVIFESERRLCRTNFKV
jgi:hypothetical protein